MEVRKELRRDVQDCESNIQACQQTMGIIDADIEVQRSALQGESWPRSNRS